MKGDVIQMQQNRLAVPDCPVIPFIEGDGTGPDIWRASQRVFDTAVEKAYGGKRRIAWREVLAGQKSFRSLLMVAALALLILSGCGPSSSQRVAAPKVDPRSAAAEAMRLYDKNGDGQLDEAELSACPAIKGALSQYDRDGDGSVSEQEIADRIADIYSTEVGLMEVQCIVTHRRRPLSGATVRFIPEPFLATEVQAAIGTTDTNGQALMGIELEHLPDQLRSYQLMQVGLYRVEIEHPSLTSGQLPSLGFEASPPDPTSRSVSAARFDL